MHLEEMADVYASAVKEMEARKAEAEMNGSVSDLRESAAPSLTDAATTATTSGVLTPTESLIFSPLGGYVSSKRRFANVDGYDLAKELSSSVAKRRKTG